MALYSLLFEYQVYDEICQNRFYYGSASEGSVDSGAFRLVGAFEDDVLPELAEVMTSTAGVVTFNRLYAVNLYDDEDFFEDFSIDPAAPTSDHGAAISTFTALSYASERYRVGKNRWYKRIAGLGQASIAGNEYITQPAAGNAGTAMTNPIEHAGSQTFYDPRLLFFNPQSDPPYKKYATEAEQRAESAIVVDYAYFNLTTQRSRKKGVGI